MNANMEMQISVFVISGSLLQILCPGRLILRARSIIPSFINANAVQKDAVHPISNPENILIYLKDLLSWPLFQIIEKGCEESF